MQNQSFNCNIAANISPAEAIKRISNVPEWWGVKFTGDSEKQNDNFVVKMGGDSFFNFTVSELIPGKKLTWLVTDCYMPWYPDKKEWAGTKLIFDFSEANGLTNLHFTHQGLTPDVQCYQDCETGWTHWITTSLHSYLTTGKGQHKKKINQSYTTSIHLPFPPALVFNRINEVAKWWPEEVKGPTANLNDEFTFSSGDIHHSKQKITESVPNEKLVWLVTDSLRKTDNFSWTGTRMTFTLTPDANGTALDFTYEGPVLENEYERLTQVCDTVIKEKFYNFIIEKK